MPILGPVSESCSCPLSTSSGQVVLSQAPGNQVQSHGQEVPCVAHTASLVARGHQPVFVRLIAAHQGCDFFLSAVNNSERLR